MTKYHMGYYYTTEPENAVPPKSWAMPKTHTPGSRLEKRGLRFYNPETGRWMSRDPIGEWGGENLLRALANDAVNKRDRLGLSLGQSQCENAINWFYRFNPKWKEKIDYWDRQTDGSRCVLDIGCGCCGGSTEGTTQETVSKPYRRYTVTICRDAAGNNASSVFGAIAHEITHFFAGCENAGDRFDCSKEDGEKFFDCSCAKFLCREIQALKKAGQCTTPDECWEQLKGRGYLKDGQCTATPPYTAPTRTRVWQFMSQCKAVAVDVPSPQYPQPVPNLSLSP